MGMKDRMDDRNMIRGRAGRRRLGRGVCRRITAMLACLVVMVAVMFSVVSIYAWIRERVKGDTAVSGTDVLDVSIDADGNVVDADGNVVGVLSGSVGLSPEEVEVQVANARQQAASEVLEDIRTRLNDGDSVVEALRPLYPDDMIVYSGGQYHVVPIDYSLKQHGREDAGLNILETGEYQYLQDGQVISHKGIDVSEHQGDIDWNLVAQDGVEFAFIRAAYRGYGTGKLVEDANFDANVQGAQAAGIKVGAYIYSQAITEEEVVEEANLVLEKSAPYSLECPIVFDVEKVTESEGRMNAISIEERTRLAGLFCQTVESAGQRPMLYYNTEMGIMMLELGALEGYDKWFAAYREDFYYPYDFKIWQYSQSGRVQGIQTEVDLNISFAPFWEE